MVLKSQHLFGVILTIPGQRQEFLLQRWINILLLVGASSMRSTGYHGADRLARDRAGTAIPAARQQDNDHRKPR